jgi:hypothetical protein
MRSERESNAALRLNVVCSTTEGTWYVSNLATLHTASIKSLTARASQRSDRSDHSSIGHDMGCMASLHAQAPAVERASIVLIARSTRRPTIASSQARSLNSAPPGRRPRGTAIEYLSVKLDDPRFPAPIYASRVKGEGDDSLTLIWSRRTAE